VILLNSTFSRLAIRILGLRRLGLIGRVPVLLGPEGEWQPGALRHHAVRKRLFLAAAAFGGLYRDVTWRATTPDEAADIRRVVGASARIIVAPVVDSGEAPRSPAPLAKTSGSVRLVYLSRITPKKNLLFLLRLLDGVSCRLDLDIVGPVDDPAYWATCRSVIDRIRPPVHVRHLGEVAPEDVPACLGRAHASVLPTFGENFGFVILESLKAGRPVLVSPHTPWHDLAACRAGWEMPLEPAAWITVLHQLAAMDQEEFDRWSAGALARAGQHAADDDAAERLEAALRETVAGAHGGAR
jgi:glycosyltransferase involved in cell wall biosynthesis